MSNFYCIILACVFIFLFWGCESQKVCDKHIKKRENILVLTENDPVSGEMIVSYFDGEKHLLLKNRFIDPVVMCDSNKAFRNEINSHPNEILFFDEQDSLVAKDNCVKIGDGFNNEDGKRFIYDCMRYEFDLKHRIRVDGFPKSSKKTIKRLINLRIERNCNGIMRIPISESEYNYEEGFVKRLAYNQNGKIESISFYTYPHEKIYEKKLFVDGEYIKTKCFANDSLKIDAKEFVDEKGSCIE